MTEPVLMKIKLGDLVPTPDNPRHITVKDPEIVSLGVNIKALGVLQPLLARPHPTQKGKYDLRAGARRHAAAGLAGLEVVPVLVRDMTDQEAIEITIVENLKRADLTAIESARGVGSLLATGWNAKQIADHLGKPPAWVARHARLAELSPKIMKLLDADCDIARWPAGWLEMIARLPGDVQEAWFRRNEYNVPGNLRKLKESLSHFTCRLSAAPWKRDDDTIDPKAGACAACSKRSSRKPGLFDDEWDGTEPSNTGRGRPVKEEQNDECLDQECWKRKLQAFTQRMAETFRAEHPNAFFVSIGGHCNEPGVISEWKVERCKQSEKGAVPALVIDGEDQGKTFFIRPPEDARSVGGAKAAGNKPKSMAEKQEGLAKRRAAMQLGSIHDLLCKAKKIPDGLTLETVARVAAVFGTWENHGMAYPSEGPLWTKMAGKDTAAVLWASVKKILERRAKTCPDYADCAKDIEEEVAGIAGILWPDKKVRLQELVRLRDESEQAIPVPKSWGAVKSK